MPCPYHVESCGYGHTQGSVFLFTIMANIRSTRRGTACRALTMWSPAVMAICRARFFIYDYDKYSLNS